MNRATRNKQIIKIYQENAKKGYAHKHILENILQPLFWLKPRTLYAIVSGENDKKK